MRVGLVVEQCLAPVPGGTGRYAYEVAAALARSAPPGSTVTGWSAWHRHPGAAVVPGVRGPRRLPLGRRTLTAAWERGVGPAPRTVDLVHAPTLLFPPRRWRPLVVTMHDAVPWTHPETLRMRPWDGVVHRHHQRSPAPGRKEQRRRVHQVDRARRRPDAALPGLSLIHISEPTRRT